MPHTQGKVVELSRLDNMSIRDIASLLSLSEQTVKNNLTLGLKALRKLLAEQSTFFLFLFYVKIM